MNNIKKVGTVIGSGIIVLTIACFDKIMLASTAYIINLF
jgi:hypothetical protein